MRRKGWFITALVCLAVSVISLFITVVAYDPLGGANRGYNIIDFLNYEAFAEDVLSEYTGSAFRSLSDSLIMIPAGIGIVAIILAFVGVITMRNQKKNVGPFILTLLGLIGTMIPSVIIIVAVLYMNQFFPGELTCGLYPIITPIAMVVCIITVTMKYHRTRAELEAQKRAEGLIFKAGDLR